MGEGPYDLTKRLAGGLDATPCRDVFAVNDGRPRGGHLPDESLIRHDPSIKVYLCRHPVSRSSGPTDRFGTVSYGNHLVTR
jgi:hypothetical protein